MNASKKIFEILQLNQEYQATKDLFTNVNKNSSIQEKQCVSRITFILKCYNNWIAFKKQKSQNESAIAVTMYDIIDNEISGSYDFQSFLLDYRYIVDVNRKAFGYYQLEDIVNVDADDESKHDEFSCNADDCFIKSRNRRERPVNGVYKEQNNNTDDPRKNAFFISNDYDGEAASKCVMAQEILDTLHCFVFHGLRLDISKYLAPGDMDKEDGDLQDIDYKSVLNDNAVKKIGLMIDSARKSSSRFRSGHSRFRNQQNNKFITTNVGQEAQLIDIGIGVETDSDIKRVGIVGGSVSDAITWRDDFINQLRRYEYNPILTGKLAIFWRDEDFDSEAIKNDLKNVTEKDKLQSNTRSIIAEATVNKRPADADCDKECEDFFKLYGDFSFENGLDETLYSQGYRYYYWPFYQNNSDQYVALYTTDGKPELDGNDGHQLGDFYISRRYETFKEEILNNVLSPFLLTDYIDTLTTATEKHAAVAHLDRFESESVKGNYIEKLYGIKPGELITISHILSVLLYTNFTDHSCSFSSTFRKNNNYESIASLKRRHSEYGHWGRYLRETVEVYGQEHCDRPELSTFYHGISQTLLFNSTDIKLQGPVSTTSGLSLIIYILFSFVILCISIHIVYESTTDFIIAWSIFGATGLVLDIKNVNGGCTFFDMNYFSSFTNEDEKLYLGEKFVLTMSNIHNIPLKIHYQKFVKSIVMLDSFINGFGMAHKPTDLDNKIMSALITNELNGVYRLNPTDWENPIPHYVSILFHQFVKTKSKLEINMDAMDLHFDYHDTTFDQDFYGFKKFKSLFMSGLTINIQLFVQLFPNITTIEIYKDGYSGFEKSIKLNESLLNMLIKCTEIVAETRGCVLSSIIIAKPLDDMDDFLNNNNPNFIAKGWNLQKIWYKNVGRGEESDALSIQIAQ